MLHAAYNLHDPGWQRNGATERQCNWQTNNQTIIKQMGKNMTFWLKALEINMCRCMYVSQWQTLQNHKPENENVLRKFVKEWLKVVHTRCLNRSGQTHARLAADKEVISNDGSPEPIYSVNNNTLKHLYIKPKQFSTSGYYYNTTKTKILHLGNGIRQPM